jgi:hypothetical protein
MTGNYPERVHSSEEEWRLSRLAERLASDKRSTGLMLAGLVAVGVGAWMIWHFGPDLRRYLKMERM